ESGFRHQIDRRRFGAAQTLRRFERRLLESAAESWMVSEADIAGARELCPTAHLRYVPNVVDLARITPVSLPQPEPRVIFVASFFYTPNRNGLSFLLDEVFPRVWAELPYTRLTLVGAGLPAMPGVDPRVEPVGFVEDLGAAYARASCAVVPLLQGGGTPLKFIEALAYGLPVVATPRAAAGLAVSDGRDCVIAEHGEQFAQALVGILRDGGLGLAPHGEFHCRALVGEAAGSLRKRLPKFSKRPPRREAGSQSQGSPADRPATEGVDACSPRIPSPARNQLTAGHRARSQSRPSPCWQAQASQQALSPPARAQPPLAPGPQPPA